MRWWEYVRWFSFEMQYLKGEKNKVADCLSCYFANDRPNKRRDVSAYMNADTRLDPDGEDLTIAWTTELFAFKANVPIDSDSQEQIKDHVEQRDQKQKS
jgi:hypothetical protein